MSVNDFCKALNFKCPHLVFKVSIKSYYYCIIADHCYVLIRKRTFTNLCWTLLKNSGIACYDHTTIKQELLIFGLNMNFVTCHLFVLILIKETFVQLVLK